MKPTSISVCLPFLALSIAPLAPLATRSTGAAPSAPQELRTEEFRTKFRQALSIKATEEIAKLVKQNLAEAQNYVETLCDAISAGNNSEQTEKEIGALRTAWLSLNQGNFVDRLYVYHSELGMDANRAFERQKIKKQFIEVNDKYNALREGKSGEFGYEFFITSFSDMAQRLAERGDHLLEGHCWLLVGVCNSESVRGKEANNYLACEGFKKCLAAYDQFEFKGGAYFQAKSAFEILAKGGFDGPPPEAGAKPSAPVPVEAAGAPVAPTVAALTFLPLSSVEEVARPHFYADDAYQLWSPVDLKAKDSTGKFFSMQASPVIKRTAAAQVGVDNDGDDKMDATLPITGNLAVVSCVLSPGTPEERPWAFVCKTGLEQDTFQGLQTNMGPADGWMSLYYLPAASMQGTVGATKLRLLDDNADGVYGSVPLMWEYMGLNKGSMQPEFDALVVGDAKRARPWSEYVELGGAWYQLRPVQNGKSLEATPVALETGTVKLDYKGEWPAWLILRGEGALSNAYFDLAENGKKGVALPVGQYKLVFGILRKGKKTQMAKCVILPGSSVPTWHVEAGKELTLHLGAPYRFEFEAALNGSTLQVSGASVTVVGSGGETYQRTWNCVPKPEVSWRKAGTKKGSKGESMMLVPSLEERDESGQSKYTFAQTWKPLDFTLDLKKPEEKIEVQLVEKKNKLFGDIESAWK